MAPSEILEPLRNDGRSLHHRNEAEKAIARLEAKFWALLQDLGWVPRSGYTCLACGEWYAARPCPRCFPPAEEIQSLGGA